MGTYHIYSLILRYNYIAFCSSTREGKFPDGPRPYLPSALTAPLSDLSNNLVQMFLYISRKESVTVSAFSDYLCLFPIYSCLIPVYYNACLISCRKNKIYSFTYKQFQYIFQFTNH